MIYFVTEARLKDFTTILGNVDAKLIMPLIPTNAQMHIKPVLGSFFFNELLKKYNDDIENGTQTLTSYEAEVVSLVQNSLIWRTVSDFVLSGSYQLTNKGAQEQNGLNSNVTSTSTIGMLKSHYNSKAEFFENRLRFYVWDESDNLPYFKDKRNNDCGVDLRPRKNDKGNTNSGIFFM